jgi:ubiquinone/menaquinone biosynthesis C-methylase UbiE
MSDQHAAFVGSIPENYDRYLGPCLFEDYAADIAQRVNVPDGGSVLEVACGTGIVTRKLRDRLPASVRLVATDLNEAMLAYAKHKFQSNEQVEFKQADAMELPFPDASFDAVVCQFGLMFFPDKERAMREVHRVLKPGCVYVFNVWDAIENNELAEIANETVRTFFESDPPTFYQVPFGLYDQTVVRKLLDDAGLQNVEMLVLAKTGMSPSAADAAKGLVEGNPVIVEINQRATSSVESIEAAVAAAIAARCGDNPVRGKLQAIVCAARR